MSQYIVILKDGSNYRGRDIEHIPGFIKIITGKREVRVPAGEVVKIQNVCMQEFDALKEYALPFIIFTVVFVTTISFI